jgi:hypothetical protein
MTISQLALLLGLAVAIPHLMGILQPAKFGAAMRKFPRSTTIGYVLVAISTAWFMRNLQRESIADFESLKPLLYLLFLVVGLGSCIFVKDFLAVRGTAVFLLLVAKVIVDKARLVESDWRLVLIVWAYAMVIAGIWFTISPWRMRDLIFWATASESRTRLFSAIRFAFGIFVAGLGLTVFKGG